MPMFLGEPSERSHNQLRSHVVNDDESKRMTVRIDAEIESGDPELIEKALIAAES